MSESIPSFVEEKLERLSRGLGEPIESLRDEYLKWYETVGREAEFINDEERHVYAIMTFWAKKVARPPTQEITFIPIGYTEERKTKSSGEPMCRVYGIYSVDGKKWEKGILVGRGAEAKIWMEVELFTSFKIKVSMGKGGGLLWAVPETTFENGTPLNLDADGKIQLLKKIGLSIFKLSSVYSNISRVVDRYVDEWDLKGIYGVVINYRTGTRSDGSKWAWYVISDDSVDSKNNVDEEGNVIPTQMTVWIPSTMLRYGRLSYLFFYGTVQRDSTGMPFMNAIGVIPIVPRELEKVM